MEPEEFFILCLSSSTNSFHPSSYSYVAYFFPKFQSNVKNSDVTWACSIVIHYPLNSIVWLNIHPLSTNFWSWLNILILEVTWYWVWFFCWTTQLAKSPFLEEIMRVKARKVHSKHLWRTWIASHLSLKCLRENWQEMSQACYFLPILYLLSLFAQIGMKYNTHYFANERTKSAALAFVFYYTTKFTYSVYSSGTTLHFHKLLQQFLFGVYLELLELN